MIGTSAACEDARSADVRGEYGFVADGASGVRAIQVANLSMNTTSDRVQSLAVNAGSDDVVSVRLQATMQDSIRWEASADGGLNWTEIAADGGWHTATTPGEDLRWRSNHVLTVAGVNPSCSSLEIEWLGAACVIDSAGDVPGDRGGWVRLVFSRSGYDVADAGAREITQYVIHRRMDRVAAARGGRARSDPYTVARVQGDPASFATMCPGAAAKGVVATGTGFPPGSWEVAGCVPALRQDTYVAVAPTVVDSVDTLSYTVFVVSAHTADPDVYFVSAPDSAFSVDNSGENIPPAAPTGFTVVRHVGGGNVLSWRANTEPDFLHYRVYRDTVESFPLNVSRRVCQTFETTWTDPVSDEQPSYYRLTAVDLLFNESAPAQAWVATGVRGQAPPGLALHRNFPNPFGPTTTIRFEVPLAGAVATMRVYDAAGRTIRTLFDGYQMGGAHAVVWDGRDDAGRPVPSGVYWCRLSGPGFVRSLKMTLVQ